MTKTCTDCLGPIIFLFAANTTQVQWANRANRDTCWSELAVLAFKVIAVVRKEDGTARGIRWDPDWVNIAQL